MPRLHSLLHALKRFTGAPENAGTSFESRPAAPDESCVTTPISVVIANCRGPEATARCLAAVLAQRFDPQAFEVIVVDDTASDEVRAMVHALAPVSGAPAVRYLRVEGAGPVAARNHGWRAATGAIVAFSDDRSLPDPDWLAGGERAMRAGHLALGGSVCVPASRHGAIAAQLGELQGASAFVRRDALERVGGFDERCATV
jgi:GT2 family glycosyltransferase